jgi:hypothetical protein
MEKSEVLAKEQNPAIFAENINNVSSRSYLKVKVLLK